jgi:hypothetical protein
MAAQHNYQKKEIEKWFLEAARGASAAIPYGTIFEFEKPDFKVHTADGELGVEVTELLRLGTGSLRPVKQENIHANVIKLAEEEYNRTPDALPVRVIVYFRNVESEKYRTRDLARQLAAFVKLHAANARPVEVFSKRQDLHEAFTAITIDSMAGRWFHGESGSITVSEIYEQLASSIRSKNELLSSYRARLPNSPIWLLIYSGIAVSRGVPIPYGIEEWKFAFGFEKVLFFSQLSGAVVEIQRTGSNC